MLSAKRFPLKTIIALIITFFASGGIAYAVVPASGGVLISPKSETATTDTTVSTTGFGQFANEAKTETCPINGKLYSKSEEALWQTRRPILAMIENHVDARPQSGLSSADVVYEAVAEGGITRFMGVFYCGSQADAAKVAPVRSARMYFVDLATEYNTPIYLHVGGGNCSRDQASGQCTSDPRAMAIEELTKLGWRKPGGNDFDSTADTGMPVLGRDYNRLGADKVLATEHTMVGYLPAAWAQATKRGYTSAMPDGSTWVSGFKAWKIDATAPTSGVTAATDIKFEFWKGYTDFDVEWKYDASTKTYLRNQGGAISTDLETKQQLAASDIVIEYAKEIDDLDEHLHLFYGVIGNGTGILFRNGVAEQITWKKATETARTVYSDQSGKEITFTPGQIWVEILPIGDKVEYN
jgi:hypothetical protein